MRVVRASLALADRARGARRRRVHRAALRARRLVRDPRGGDAGRAAPPRRLRHDARQPSARSRSRPRRGPMRARLYEPAGSHTRAALLTSGLHASGIDEPRLVRLAQQHRRQPHRRRHAGHPGAVALRDRPGDHRCDRRCRRLARRGRDAGAGSPRRADGHQLQRRPLGGRGGTAVAREPRRVRVLVRRPRRSRARPAVPLHRARAAADARRASSGRRRRDSEFVLPPHDYGVAVILLSLADRVVPAAQVERLRAGVRQYLWASALDGGVDKARAPASSTRCASCRRRCPSRRRRCCATYRPRRRPPWRAAAAAIGSSAAAEGLSVSKSPKPTAPVFLLHGLEDNVVPAVESEYLADDLAATRRCACC